MEVAKLKNKFIEIYGGTDKTLRVFSAPGRVNLIGEHTDYNGGFVLPAALTVSSTVIIRPRKDRQINLAATDLTDRVSASLDELEKYKSLKWGNYQLGVADELQKSGYKLVGCDMLFHDTVPIGAGLSSSAAIEVVTALALATLSVELNNTNKEINMTELALISQRAENNYVGVNCGIMDQFASAMGRSNNAIFLNCRDLSYRLVPLNLKDHKIIIANTNKRRSLAQSEYNRRKMECETGLNILKQVLPKLTCLGELSFSEFDNYKHLLKDEIIRNRVEHVISENERVLKSVQVLKQGDLDSFGRLMIQSHNSLKELYEVTGPELDTLVELALGVNGVIGSRMTGAGFGGCTVNIVRQDSVDIFIEKVGKGYLNKIGYKASFYVCDIGDGAREII